MLQIVLVRPGSTDYDVQQRIQGGLDIPLNEQGMTEAAETAELLRPWAAEIVYAPGSQPSWQTAQIIAKTLGIKSKKLERLKNLHMGLWEGMLVEDVRRKQPKVYRQWQEQPECVCPPEGEMLADADERLRAAMVKIIKKHDDGVVVLVLPEPLMSLARRFVGRVELGDLWKASCGHDRIESFTIDTEAFLAAGVGSE